MLSFALLCWNMYLMMSKPYGITSKFKTERLRNYYGAYPAGS
jgi:hypothetical protein